MILLLFYFLLAIGVSFLCSVLEAVFLSLSPSYVAARRQEGTRSGRLMDRMKRNVDRPLAAILSLNTIAHTVGAAGVGAQAQVVFQSVPLSVISGVLTLLILILSEIIPKTLGATYWRSLAVPATWTIHFLTLAVWPLVLLSQAVTHVLERGHRPRRISRDEIGAMAELGLKEGVLDPGDTRLVHGMLRLRQTRAREALTPRGEVATLSPEDTVGAVTEEPGGLAYSRYPVLRGDDEGVDGFVLKNDLLLARLRGEENRPVGELAREVLILPDTVTLKRALSLFLARQEHLAVVVDEYGSFAGVLTLEDVLEDVLGDDITDETDPDVPSTASPSRRDADHAY